ncbi:putative cyclic nucleotide-gated ion channel 13 [Salvia miltiorrhiza]|uniref:putative cyclic nucleotide-gated ion channel 13 n=1 Tax=Salvia miltiorrhiza TaxID=226208 RepID=UPI0025AB97A7|nr:putative cyclic nucleotide-gated ion channel 13 [Salvia miltiorrhiza]XP_057802681.1 putative cyclic nucleotide-gated ion channel 13 [Salvia miltiorrhiza]XP_057802682.1 putative cyclic nucleotide-gated ion channel 13 [Salvia miltiorrhiza]XP_057802683.1 putative cyclic nucleotide-gated ion channel 13 [Salvia miltiorrhiza]XP_057802684.1 putative cyclic nucleotide-gated ion channel 13 [Salvia miltiorrhiza]XP_057802685.1 putative cyclic nucleotide-gated ion channel 13 [Salvia miltiorrhiza]XP_05
MRVKRRDAEQWMSRCLLPESLRQRIQIYKWQEIRGVDEDNLIPKDLRRDIKHLCLAFILAGFIGPMYAKEILQKEMLSHVGVGEYCETKSATLLPLHKAYPVIPAASAKAGNASADEALLCKSGTLNPRKAKGKFWCAYEGTM